jgi:hypothetical protein
MGNRRLIQFKNLFKSVPIIIISISFLLLNCNEQSTSPNGTDNIFSFKVKVVDSLNSPLSNVKIGTYFHLSDIVLEKSNNKETDINYGVTSISYAINDICKLYLTAYDLENRAVMNLVQNDRHNVGRYQVHFNTGELFPGVYKCVLIAKDTLDINTLYKDSIYAVLLHTDPVYNGIGYTDNNGIFETQNKLYFPALYELPVIIRTLEGGPEPFGSFNIDDSITILVTDTVLNITSRYTREIKNLANNFELIFPGNETEIIVEDKMMKLGNINTVENTNDIWKKLAGIYSVGLEYFEATTENNDVILNWKTNWEINNSGFEIQREVEYSGYIAIGYVSGHGTTNEEHTYSFIDKSLFNGDYKYRLKIIDFDGNFEYSDSSWAHIWIPGGFSLEQNYPNPFN